MSAAADERLRPFTEAWRQRYGVPASISEPLMGLDQEFVRAGLCDWTARTAPHPSHFTLVVARYLAESGVLPDVTQ